MALSNAERQARWRAKLKDRLAALRNGDGSVAQAELGGEIARLQAELNAAQREITRLKQGRAEAEPTITPDMLSMSAQEKLAVAMRQYKRQLERMFDEAVRVKYVHALNVVLPDYKREMGRYEAVIKARRGVMPKRIFNRILACLHPDESTSKQVLAEMFDTFKNLEFVLVAERESPTPDMSGFPSNYEELMQRTEKAAAERRAKRPAAKSTPQPRY